MAGKTGKKPTGRKPQSVRRQSDLADGAFGRENVGRMDGKGRAGPLDKAVSKNPKTGGAGA
jgi:hypothetical protein